MVGQLFQEAIEVVPVRLCTGREEDDLNDASGSALVFPPCDGSSRSAPVPGARTHQAAINGWIVRASVLVFLALLGLQVGEVPGQAAASPSGASAVSRPAIRGGNGAFRAFLLQTADSPAESPPEPDNAAELVRIAALTSMVNQQGSRSLGNLERVSSIEIVNRTLRPEFVVDARMERVAAANTASEAAALEAARSAELAAEAQAKADAAVAAALAADQANDEAVTLAAQAAARATQEADAATLAATREAEASAAVATRTADAEAAASAVREAEASAAAATALAEAQAAAAAGSHQFTQRVMMLLLVLALLVGSFLGLRYWRNRKEPFVLKAIPVSVTVQAHA